MAENTNKNNTGKAVNQNNILNIIESSVKEIESIVDAIASLNQKIKIIRMPDIKDMGPKTKILFGKQGVITELLKDICDSEQFMRNNQSLSSYVKMMDDLNIIIEKTAIIVPNLKKIGVSLSVFIFNEEKLGKVFDILRVVINGMSSLPTIDAKENAEKMINIAKLIGLFHLAVLTLILLAPSIMVFIILSPFFISFASSCYVIAHTLPLLYYVVEGLAKTAVACSELKSELKHIFGLGSGKSLKKQIGYLLDVIKLIINKLAEESDAMKIDGNVIKYFGYVTGLMHGMLMLSQITLEVKQKLFRLFLLGKGNFMKRQISALFDVMKLTIDESGQLNIEGDIIVKMLELTSIFMVLDKIVEIMIPIKRKLFRLFLLGKGNFMKRQIRGLFEILLEVLRGPDPISFKADNNVLQTYVYITLILKILVIITDRMHEIAKNLFKTFLFSKNPSRGMLYRYIKGLFSILNKILERGLKISIKYPSIGPILWTLMNLVFLLGNLIIITNILISFKKKLFKLFLFGKGTTLNKRVDRLFNLIYKIIFRAILIDGIKKATKKLVGIVVLLWVLKIIIGIMCTMIMPMILLAAVSPLFLLGFKLLTVIIRLIARWSSFIDKKMMLRFKKLTSALGAIVLICAALLLIAYAFSKIAANQINIISLISLVFILAGIFALIGKIPERRIGASIPVLSAEDLALGAVITLCSSLLFLVTNYLAVATNWADIFKVMIVTVFVAVMLIRIGKIKKRQITRAEKPLAAENIGIGLIVSICATLLLLVTKYLAVAAKWTDIFKIILLVVVVSVLLVGLGFMMRMGLPILQATLMVLGIVFLSISTVFLIVLELFILQNIKLDYDKIKANVSAVIKTSFFIITCIFDSVVDGYGSEEDNIFTKILKTIFKSAASIYMAFLGAAILVATVVSVFAILLICSMLWLLGKITLNEGAIRTNVGLILGLAKDIISLIWDSGENKDGEESDKGWLGSLIDYVLEPLGAILQAIMAVAYLALIVISVLFILLIAGQLRLLQEINLDEGAIKSNVSIVLKIADSIISTIFNGGEKDGEKSNKSWLGSLIDYVFEPLGAILQAIMAVAYLALIIVAVMFILLIAGQLRGLQEIDLQEGVINEKVGIVLSTANSVIDSIWNRKDTKGTESKKGFLRSVFSMMGIGPLMDALMSIAFLAQTVATVGLIAKIADQLNSLQKIDLQSDKITTNVELVIKTAQDIIDKLWNNPERPGKKPSKESKGFFNCVNNFLYGDKGQDINDMASAAAFLTQTLSTIGAIHSIAKFLNELQKIQLQEGPINATIERVIETSHRIIDKLWNEDAKNNKTDIISEFLGICRKAEKRNEQTDIEQMSHASNFMSYALASIVSIYKIANLLSSLSKIKIAEANITEVVNRVILTAKTVSDKVAVAIGAGDSDVYNKGSDEFKKRFDKISGFRTYINKSIETIIGTMNGWTAGLAKVGLRDLVKLDISDTIVNDIKTKTNNVFTLSSHILGNVHDIMKKLPSSYDKEVSTFTKSLSDITTSFCDNKITDAGISRQERALNNYAKFVTKIQTLDLKKLESAERMFKHMAEFSRSVNGNFDRLADSINDKIMPLLNELNENLVKFKETQKEIELTRIEVENGIKPDNKAPNPFNDLDNGRINKVADTSLNNRKEKEEKSKFIASTIEEISEILMGYHNSESQGFKVKL